MLLISGSPRKEGNTAQVLARCAGRLEELGLEAEVISLAGRPIAACVACYKCLGSGSCALDDELNDITGRIRAARGLIVGSPVYFGTARGDLLNLLQRVGMLSYNNDKFLSWKVGGPVTVNRRGGATSAVQELLMFFLINEMIVPGSSYWNIVYGKKPGEAVHDEEGMVTLLRFAENVGKLILGLK